jgi:hypothetical protein
MRKVVTGLILVALFLFGTGFKSAEVYRWRDHAPPFEFLFENHIDTHQQSKIAGNGNLVGFLYVRFTGEYTAEGYPIARHADCANVPDQCAVGWELQGIPFRATYLGHEHGQHPQWKLDPDAVPSRPGYTRFHWLNESAQADGGFGHGYGLTVGQEYDGYLLKLTARGTFFLEHHGGFLVTPGIDEATHANIVMELD